MYLKSLVLKGFKSFADRSALALEPGITAIVGPNGSGKSNISDAVLWVLGERSARNLRGQAMEDIIFSGSAARKAVSVAEVDLVLDNSDGTLPVEFDEVVIARKMYRSGESEYLVNGVVSRRLDVLDILHDTGLGTGTHSIISQGSLDSILQSKPEDRRALIEEAAGVLKHKQRKEKSARKLEAMDNNLNRVRDVAGEVARQLGPLERKAKKAAAYIDASTRLAEVNLMIAVDDLRSLQEKWDIACKAEKAISDEVEQRRESVNDAEQKVNDFQEMMKRETEDAGELAKRQRRASSLVERLDGAEMLLRERRRSAVAYEADTNVLLEGSALRKSEAQKELGQARSQFASAKESHAEAQKKVDELSKRKSELDSRALTCQEELDRVAFEVLECEGAADEARAKRENMQEALANGLAHMKLVEARKLELSSDLDKASREHAHALEQAQKARVLLEELEAKDEEAHKKLLECFERREQAQQRRDEAREDVKLAESEIKAVERSLRASREEDPALLWLLDNSERFSGGVLPLSGALTVEGGMESLVESLLGEDLGALAIQDAAVAESVAKALADGAIPGDVSLVLRDQAMNSADARTLAPKGTHALVDAVECGAAMKQIVDALLGDVVLCESLEQGLALQSSTRQGLRFASPDGCVVHANGKVRIFGARDMADDGILARERKLAALRKDLGALEKALGEAERQASAEDEAYRKAQATSLKLNQELANHKGVCSAASAEEERSSQKLRSITAEVEDIGKQVELAQKNVDELRPEMKKLDKQIAELGEKRAKLVSLRDEKTHEMEPIRAERGELDEQLSEMKLSATKFQERRNYAERMVEARKRDIDNIEAEVEEAERTLAIKRVAVKRGTEILAIVEALSGGLSSRARVLEDALSASEDATNSVHSQASTARAAARKAHDDYDEASARMSQARVEKSRLEVQVEAAVNVVVKDCGTPLEVAEQLPMLENRQEVEDEKFKLERRIRNMGSINPDAAEEYAKLKERYDYLQGQLSDVEAARRSLNRVVRVIDERMKDDFVRTFDEVNANFGEIFSLLFPGGAAHLSLVDPEDVENAGVEVSAQPRGKRLTKMMLMSGGEKSLTALALLFAVYKTRTTPFYILDEVEAALDDTNLRRLIAYIDTLRSTTQLIMITHQRRTMEMADVLFGVSMQADGVTKVISQKLERALEQAS